MSVSGNSTQPLALQISNQNPLCLLPIGDSITEGEAYGEASWRYPLWKRLVDNGKVVQWTGSRKWQAKSKQYPYKGLTFQNYHEGWNSQTADFVLKNIRKWIPQYTCVPSHILIHLGINDCGRGEDPKSTVSELMQIIQILRSSYQYAMILLAVPIPACVTPHFYYGSCTISTHNQLAAAIRSQDGAFKSDGVFIVEMEPGFDGFHGGFTDLLGDKCHPNPQGEEKMAANFFDAMERHGNTGWGRQISCGSHFAGTCAECPQGNGADWCNGQCQWEAGKWYQPWNAGQCVWNGGNGGIDGNGGNDGNDGNGGTPGNVKCGAHTASNCASCPQGNGAGWCNGDCYWGNGHCLSRNADVLSRDADALVSFCTGVAPFKFLSSIALIFLVCFISKPSLTL
jgi:lysophospholipase L1-like esterase